MTNRELINRMSNKELAEFIKDRQPVFYCGDCVLINTCDSDDSNNAYCITLLTEWLESEAEE